jgi:hypothetical protein
VTGLIKHSDNKIFARQNRPEMYKARAVTEVIKPQNR